MWISKLIGALCLFFTLTAWAAVDINTASSDDLTSIKGIGPSTSAKILDQRKKAKFKSWEDFIQRVSGIGEARANKLSQQGLTVNGDKFQATSTKPQKQTAANKPAQVAPASTAKHGR
ncbi:MAG: helix-hairpin-helix domain-containing protein [Burkholderiaceae bacterium]